MANSAPSDTQNVNAEDYERLYRECFALAANQCHEGYGDEGGRHRCKYQDVIQQLERELTEAKVFKMRASELRAELEDARSVLQMADSHLNLIYPGGVEEGDFLCCRVRGALERIEKMLSGVSGKGFGDSNTTKEKE